MKEFLKNLKTIYLQQKNKVSYEETLTYFFIN
jgi:hypothetical protein